ncbi:hypothetical protein SAMN06265784_108147 [Paraburkholderia susongensis]|uniref:Uncharacterized protein n=1 Tax=Paraburkholderia susongensis TaxID=1515439 RepID=A0A1X7LR32_9BURK|nr:hypothetical protein SAMN06265784_108147 [Paraburkholderia susongensis]
MSIEGCGWNYSDSPINSGPLQPSRSPSKPQPALGWTYSGMSADVTIRTLSATGRHNSVTSLEAHRTTHHHQGQVQTVAVSRKVDESQVRLRLARANTDLTRCPVRTPARYPFQYSPTASRALASIRTARHICETMIGISDRNARLSRASQPILIPSLRDAQPESGQNHTSSCRTPNVIFLVSTTRGRFYSCGIPSVIGKVLENRKKLTNKPNPIFFDHKSS